MQKRTDDILAQTDEKGISDKKLRKEVTKVKEESVPKMKEYKEKFEILGERDSYSKTDKDATFRSVYRSKDCSQCPLRSMCYTGQHNTKTIVVNHHNNELRAMARELLTSDEGLLHRSRRPIEPEAVFGQIKYDNHFKRFSYRGKRLVNAEFVAIAVAHNIRKMISKGYSVRSEVAVG